MIVNDLPYMDLRETIEFYDVGRGERRTSTGRCSTATTATTC
jgi:hypothetical protein